jgi:hypothetical protein
MTGEDGIGPHSTGCKVKDLGARTSRTSEPTLFYAVLIRLIEKPLFN